MNPSLSTDRSVRSWEAQGPAVQRRRVDREKVRVLVELMLTYPGATLVEYADRLGVTVRTIERWRKYPAFQAELREQSERHYQSTLVPLALERAKRILQNPGARADALVIEILRGQGLLGIPRMDVHHSGTVVTEDGDSLREALIARIAEHREQQARALPEAMEVVVGDVVEADPDAPRGETTTDASDN
jgi:hypothetical protein